MRAVLLLGLMAMVATPGCDTVKSIVFAKDPMKTRRAAKQPVEAASEQSAPPKAIPVKSVSLGVPAPPTRSYRRESIAPGELAEITQAASFGRQCLLESDHERLIDRYYAPLLELAGGREHLLQVLQQQDAYVEAKGISFDSLELGQPDVLHVGERFRLCFIRSILTGRVGPKTLRQEGFFIVFAEVGSNQWYVLNGSRLTHELFHQMLPGFPEDLALPAVHEEVVPSDRYAAPDPVQLTGLRTPESPALAASPKPQGEVITDLDCETIMAKANRHKAAMLSHNADETLDLMDPVFIEAIGGRTQLRSQLLELFEMMKSGEFVIDSFELSRPEVTFRGATHRVCFVRSLGMYRYSGAPARSEGFMVAYARHNSADWYLIDGSQLNPQLLNRLFPGLPADCQLPPSTLEYLSE